MGARLAAIEEALIADVARHERGGDLAAGVRALAVRGLDPQALMAAAAALYRRDAGATAFFICEQLLQAGAENWILHALAAHLAIRLDRPGAVARSAPRLKALLAANAEERASARALLDPFLPLDAVGAFARRDAAKLDALMQVWAAVEPGMMARLALPQPGREPDPTRLAEAARALPLYDFASPPAGAPPRRRKAVVAIRGRWIPHHLASRRHELPPRIGSAIAAYGWEPIAYDISSFVEPDKVAADYRAIAALVREHGADLVILDDFQPVIAGSPAPGETVGALQREQPGLRVVALYLDNWNTALWPSIEAGAALVDVVWAPIAAALWQRPAFRGKLLHAPLPHGGDHAGAGPARATLAFAGGVQYTNWYRAPWLAAIAAAGLPLELAVSSHQDDALNALDSYRAYMRRMAAARTMLNFAYRSDGTAIVTGRTFEALATGCLLVQERADEIDRFLVPNRHYLRFETLADLADIVALIESEPRRAEEIRRAGAAFFRERYADAKLIGYLDAALFHRAAAEAF